MNKLNIIKTKAIRLWLVAKRENYRIQELLGLGFHRNDKQKILYDFFLYYVFSFEGGIS